MNFRYFDFMRRCINTGHLLEALLFVFQLKDRVSVKDISLSGDKLDHKNQKVPHIG